MSLIDKIAVWLIFSGIMGTSFCFVWIVFSNALLRRSNPRIAYAGLKLAVVMMHIPINYFLLNKLPKSNENGEVITFFPFVTSGISRIFAKIVIVWLIGVFIFAVKRIYGTIRLRQNLRLRLPCEKRQLIMLEKKKEQLKIKTKIHAYRCYNVPSPLIVGIARPAIYLPVNEYSDEQLELIFTHELYHHKKHDVLWRGFVEVCSVLFWFNPLFLTTIYYNDKIAEAACDSDCLLHYKHSEYFRTILDMKVAGSRLGFSYSMLMRENRQLLWRVKTVKKRIKRGLNTGKAVLAYACIAVFGSYIAYAVTDIVNELYTETFWDTMLYVEMFPEEAHKSKALDDGATAENGGVVLVEEIDDLVENSCMADEMLDEALCDYGEYFINANGKRYKFEEAFVAPWHLLASNQEWFEQGEILEISIGVEPASAVLVAGLVDSGGRVIYITGNDHIRHNFCVEKGGLYRFFVKNMGDVEIYVTCSYIKSKD